MEQPEIHAPHHPHGGLPRWLEWVTSVSALIVSVTSIAIAVHSGDTMEKLVTANSFPYLEGGYSDATPEGVEQISVDLRNRGVGPAHEQSLKIKVAGRYVTSFTDLVTTVVGSKEAPEAVKVLRSYKNGQPTRFIPGDSSQFIFQVRKTDANARYWDMLDASGPGWQMEYCYCSVFKECWAVHDAERKPVKQCVRDEPHEFAP
jgi:hypothetical protein